MAINKYLDFVLVANDVEKDENGLDQFSVEVFASPRGGGLRVAKQKIPPDLRKDLGHLERRKLGADGVISLGEKLADLLLPGEVCELFSGTRIIRSAPYIKSPAIAEASWPRSRRRTRGLGV